jgi:multiple sugar transport system permease protein
VANQTLDVGEARPLTRSGGSLTFKQRRHLFMLFMGVPAVLYVAAIALWPIAQGLYYSLFDYNLIRPQRTQFIGLDNYTRLLFDPTAYSAIKNTFVFTLWAVSIQFVLGMLIALLLWRDDRFNRITLALILVPMAITPLAVGLVFHALLAADFGLIGYYLAEWGITDPRGMFADPFQAMLALVIMDIWQWTPLMALILLAGLKALPTDILEAAEVDGASGFQRFFIIILPLMLPAIFLALVLRTMDAFRIFDSVFVTTRGGPGDATNVLMYYAVKEGLEFFNIGFASAIATVTLVCIGLFAVVFILLIRTADKRINT